MRFFLAILILLSAAQATQFKVASYNVENLFDLVRDGSEYAEYIPNTSWQWNSKNYRIKLKNIASVIAEVKPDIIALQEIESSRALKDLQRALKQEGHYMPYRAIADAKSTTVKNAILSRYPIEVKKEVWVTKKRRYRNILEVKIEIDNRSLYLFVNHWKSKGGAESRRIVSAKALKKRIDTLGDKNIILLGDFNSHYDEKHLFKRNRKHNDTGGITGINDILKSMRGNRGIRVDDLKVGSDYFSNLWYELPNKERWSHNFYGKKQSLDSMLISAKLYDKKGLEYVKGSFNRYNEDYLFYKKRIYRWQQSRKYPKRHLGRGYSDHLLIYANFTTTGDR